MLLMLLRTFLYWLCDRGLWEIEFPTKKNLMDDRILTKCANIDVVQYRYLEEIAYDETLLTMILIRHVKDEIRWHGPQAYCIALSRPSWVCRCVSELSVYRLLSLCFFCGFLGFIFNILLTKRSKSLLILLCSLSYVFSIPCFFLCLYIFSV